MAEQKTQTKVEEKAEETKVVETKPVQTEAKAEEKPAEKKEEKKKEVKITKKDEAIAWGLDLHASKKHCMYISKFIKGKSIDTAIADLERVIKLKKIVPFKGEIPHRRGKGMMSGRYPVNASKLVIPVLKGLKGNVLVNGMDLDKTKIYYASASWASLPHKKGGARFKRTNLIIKAREFVEAAKPAKKEKKENKNQQIKETKK